MLVIEDVIHAGEAVIQHLSRRFSVHGIQALDPESLSSMGHEVLWEILLKVNEEEDPTPACFIGLFKVALRNRILDEIDRETRRARREQQMGSEYLEQVDVRHSDADTSESVDLTGDTLLSPTEFRDLVTAEAAEEYKRILTPNALRIILFLSDPPEQFNRELESLPTEYSKKYRTTLYKSGPTQSLIGRYLNLQYSTFRQYVREIKQKWGEISRISHRYRHPSRVI